MLKQLEEQGKAKREDKRKNGKAEKLFEMNLKLCVIHNHEAKILNLYLFVFYSQNRRGAC